MPNLRGRRHRLLPFPRPLLWGGSNSAGQDVRADGVQLRLQPQRQHLVRLVQDQVADIACLATDPHCTSQGGRQAAAAEIGEACRGMRSSLIASSIIKVQKL